MTSPIGRPDPDEVEAEILRLGGSPKLAARVAASIIGSRLVAERFASIFPPIHDTSSPARGERG